MYIQVLSSILWVKWVSQWAVLGVGSFIKLYTSLEKQHLIHHSKSSKTDAVGEIYRDQSYVLMVDFASARCYMGCCECLSFQEIEEGGKPNSR